MQQIENKYLKIQIAEKGAELQSILSKETNTEYLWNADPKFWAKKSPVLFPIVGGLKNNSYTYEGKNFSMGRHGFARDMNFSVADQKQDSIEYTLISNETTLEKYPFMFEFSVRYSLTENKLTITYIVENKDAKEMFFSVGAHPAFKVPIIEGTSFEDYYLLFNKKENASHWPLSNDGLIELQQETFLENTDKLPLKKELFYKDALVFKHLKSSAISIRSNKTERGITVVFDEFPYMGIWSAKDADFVCIEPWLGIADSVNATGNLQEKEGILSLGTGKIFKASWNIEVF